MKTKIKGRLSLATCLSVSALVLCTSTPGWADNPYQRGHRVPGSFANQHRGTANKQQIEAHRRAQEARQRAQQAEANRRAHLRDRAVQSDGAFVQPRDIPQAGVDQKGGVFDNVRHDNPDVQRRVGTPRRDTNEGQQQRFNIQPKQTEQQRFNIQPKREVPQQQLDKEAQRQARFAEFDEKYRAICARTNKPDCTPPPHPTTSGRGTSSYEESISGVM